MAMPCRITHGKENSLCPLQRCSVASNSLDNQYEDSMLSILWTSKISDMDNELKQGRSKSQRAQKFVLQVGNLFLKITDQPNLESYDIQFHMLSVQLSAR